MARKSQRVIQSPNLKYSLDSKTQTGWFPPVGFLFPGLSCLYFSGLKGKTRAGFLTPNK